LSPKLVLLNAIGNAGLNIDNCVNVPNVLELPTSIKLIKNL